jgi:hypothetical protein
VNQTITEEHLRRRAIVYVRQSTPIQLVQNRESQLRQYGLAEHARKLGFCDVETIDANYSSTTFIPKLQLYSTSEGFVGAHPHDRVERMTAFRRST